MAEIEKLICVNHGGKPIGLHNFYIANDVSIYRGVGHIPICKKCLFKLAQEYYERYKDMQVAIYFMCMKTDIAFNEGIYSGASEKCEDNADKVFQSYITQYNSLGSKNRVQMSFNDGEHLLSFYSGEEIEEQELEEISEMKSEIRADIDIEIFWGSGFTKQDYLFLETELKNWTKTHKCDNQAEITLLKEICVKILEIRRLRESGKSVSKEQKELQDLMKTASVDPAKANAISDGQSVDRFGVWIKDIEQYRPAEWWDDQEKYKDMDDFIPYIKNYIVRPVKNFFTGVKDFVINGDDLSFKD